MKDILPDLTDWVVAGDRVAVATVVGVHRSAPRPPGAKMAVNADGRIVGAVSGGCVVGAVVGVAEQILHRGAGPALLHYGIADEEAWDVGLPCGGEIEVWVAEHRPSRFEEIAAVGGRAARVTVLEGEHAGAQVLLEPGTQSGEDGRDATAGDGNGRASAAGRDANGHRAAGPAPGGAGATALTGSLGDRDLDARALAAAGELLWTQRSERRGDLFVDVVHPPPRLIVFGAVDFAAAVCTLARAAGWRPYVVDPRERFATPERFPDAEEVVCAWPDRAFEQLGGIDPATSIAVLTHDPKLDDAALLIALRSDADYVGAMGSRRAQASRRERLLEAGVDEEELARLAAPIGLDLGATSNEETALSIVAEVVAHRNGREGGRLTHASGRIHDLTSPDVAGSGDGRRNTVIAGSGDGRQEPMIASSGDGRRGP
ncbi:MAG: XdhC family protein [Actinomycetota bacterium]|nr:XdhC family protein [Actinomycetota bacterium]